MAAYNFRTAFNGFHREDVVHYIEYINAKHNTLVNQLKSDLDALRQENDRLATEERQDPELEMHAAELTDKVALLEAELEAVRKSCADLEAELTDVKAQRDAALSEQESVRRRNEEELEAYRRAERMERQAKERTEAMYQKANGVLADATAKVDDASAQITGIADQVAAQLAVLPQAVGGSKTALKDAAATLYTIRLTGEE